MLPLTKTCIMFCAMISSLQSFRTGMANASENSNQSYFEKRKTALKNMKVTFIKRPKNSKIPKDYYENPQPYEHNFKKIINEPDICSKEEKILLLYAVRSVYYNFARRQIHRDNIRYIPNDIRSTHTIVKQVFLMGTTNNSTIQSLVQKESEKYRDIIQEDFLESYANLSLKGIMAWKWSVEFCSNAEYVIVMNDELFVDQYKLMHYLHYHMTLDGHDNRFTICFRKSGATNRRLFLRRNINMSMFYKGNHYPYFCDGVGYVAHINFINKLYIASLSNHVFMPDGVWNGLLAEKLNTSLQTESYLYAYYNVIERFSHPLYQFSLLMFGVTDHKLTNYYALQILKNISHTVKIRRTQYRYKMSETFLMEDVPIKINYPSYIRKRDTENLELCKNNLNSLFKNTYEYGIWKSLIFFCVFFILFTRYKT
ncbi:beta-1,3-galactosyltransferase 2-like isoform X2 [Octopus sinensis]|nr:beta-1,3-galactosyltransferase 2-like isoform X2 [Octopus sinensis]